MGFHAVETMPPPIERGRLRARRAKLHAFVQQQAASVWSLNAGR